MKNSKRIVSLIIAFVILVAVPAFTFKQDPLVASGFAILLFAGILWISEAIPLSLTALLIPMLAIIFGILNPVDAFSRFAHPIIFLFMGSFVLASAISKFQLDRFLAMKMVRMARGKFIPSAIMVMSATAFISMWINNTSTTAMMLPLGIGLLALAQKDHLSNESKFMMLGIAYAANIGGVATLIGSAPNAIGASALNITFTEWIKYGLPVFVITFPVLILILYLFFKPGKNLRIEFSGEIKLPPGNKWKIILAIFSCTVLLWLAEAPLAKMLGIQSHLNVLIVLVAVFFILVFNILSWQETQNGIDWGVLLLFGGGLTLGTILDTSGFGSYITSRLINVVSGLPPFLLILIIVAISIVFTEFMSNTASAALFVPLLAAMAVPMQIDPAVLVIPATIAASFGFMLPVGTPPNALVFGTGLVPQRDMIKVGIILNIVFSVLISLSIYFFH